MSEVTISEHDGVRSLHFGTPWVQGSMRIDDPHAIHLEYVQRMMAWMLLRDAAEVAEGHAVQLGLGAGTITRFTAQRLGMRTTAVERDPAVLAACRRWFRLPADSERLRVLLMDAADFVADPARRGSVDALAVDLYDEDAAAPVLDSAGFYADCRALLAPRGVVAVNLFGRHASLARSLARIVAAFGIEHVVTLRPTREGNTVVLAMKDVTLPPVHDLVRRAENIDTRWRLPARKWVRMLRAVPAPSAPSTPA
jgi:spermidine synthase